ncbi:uncharacterized protein LOC143961937 [Lithobates pipiens]
MPCKGKPVHPQRKTKKSEGLEMALGEEDEQDTYVNLSDLNLQRQEKGAKSKAAKNTKIRLMLILMAFLIFLFLVQVVFISILFTFYKNMAEEQSHLKEIGENMAKEQSRLRETKKNITEGQSRLKETDKNITEGQSCLKETGENMAKGHSRLRETDENIIQEQSRLKESVTSELKKSRDLNNEVAGSLFNKIQRNFGVVGKLLEEVRKMNSSAQPLCDKSWKHYGLSCYYKSTKEVPMNSAKEDCEKNKAHLVIINGEDEMNFLQGFVDNQYWWIGLRMVNGAWEWIDGTSYEMTPKFWGKRQPNNSSIVDFPGGQECVQFSNKYGWDDRQCAIKYKYICEKEIL